ncbi:DUF4870 domain-containing protein [Dyella psychrodurans]|uniref:DUF4870 domain-containing protein n=1 Tax=Dyella psychrodurans TaxID=1927960 RepID=A0A370XEF5_9GAMM|nr:DUF4870 domain-containing protein [Dyella psychrodurans]RDS86806.1 DUF4870 domain-containing protein [Dyella psychrodurans]
MSTPSDQVSPPAEPIASSNDRNLAMLTHLSGFVFYFIVPLIVWLIHKDRPDKAYLTSEAKEALNFQITITIAGIACTILQVILIGFLLMGVLWFVNLIFCIVAAVKVSSDGHYRYPFALRLIN